VNFILSRMPRFFKISLVSFTALSLCALVSFSLFNTKSASAQAALSAAQQQQLQAQLDEIEKEIAAQQSVLDSTKQQAASISRDISILDEQISEAKLQIQAQNIAIAQLGKDITVKTQVIGTLSDQITTGKNSLAEIIREQNELDQYSLPEILLSNENLSDFFADVGSYNSLKQSLQSFFGEVETAKTDTEAQKQSLTNKQQQALSLLASIQSEQKQIQQNEAQKQTLLNLNKQQQVSYQSVINDKEAQANAIRDALFSLRDAGPINFGTALQYAQAASVKTGVSPAFLLAILTQETNLGANIGSCYLSDANGNGVKITSGNPVSGVMKASRDVQPFLALMAQLGRDPYHTAVSCPQSIGYGGGMGPSQFIPSTWALMESDIAVITGKTTPDPYNASDAFMASALYLSNLGADNSTADDRNAACRYYSGKACTTESYNGFYGDSVLSIMAKIQANIDILQEN